MAHNSALAPSVNCSLDDIDLAALKVSPELRLWLKVQLDKLQLHQGLNFLLCLKCRGHYWGFYREYQSCIIISSNYSVPTCVDKLFVLKYIAPTGNLKLQRQTMVIIWNKGFCCTGPK